eukprot:201719-Rhodomonas_salina.1
MGLRSLYSTEMGLVYTISSTEMVCGRVPMCVRTFGREPQVQHAYAVQPPTPSGVAGSGGVPGSTQLSPSPAPAPNSSLPATPNKAPQFLYTGTCKLFKQVGPSVSCDGRSGYALRSGSAVQIGEAFELVTTSDPYAADGTVGIGTNFTLPSYQRAMPCPVLLAFGHAMPFPVLAFAMLAPASYGGSGTDIGMLLHATFVPSYERATACSVLSTGAVVQWWLRWRGGGRC